MHSSVTQRRLLAGIGQYNVAAPHWYLTSAPCHLSKPEAILGRLLEQRPAGVLLPAVSASLTDFIAGACGVPVVSMLDGDSRHTLRYDEEAIGAMAAEHFLQRHHRHFAYIGQDFGAWSEGRLAGFRRRLEAEGRSVEALLMPPRKGGADDAPWRSPPAKLVRFLRRLPMPVAIFTGNDVLGMRVLNACRDAAIAVPEQAAVMGADNDMDLCLLCDPLLSSVEMPTQRLGRDAAAYLDALMGRRRGQEASASDASRPVIPPPYPPVRPVVRKSSAVLAVSNTDLAAALHHIEIHACDGLSVSAVAAAVGVSRRHLERLFRDELGRPPGEEVRRVQMEHAKNLLADTKLPRRVIAERCGISERHLTAAFVKAFGITPSEFRTLERKPSTD
ncbi:MAG: substrate-binding domain-containing protein [Planctomycetota bacterium]